MSKLFAVKKDIRKSCMCAGEQCYGEDLDVSGSLHRCHREGCDSQISGSKKVFISLMSHDFLFELQDYVSQRISKEAGIQLRYFVAIASKFMVPVTASDVEIRYQILVQLPRRLYIVPVA